MSLHDTSQLLCPECSTYLLDQLLNLLQYKSCKSCGYARRVDSTLVPMIGDDAGNGIDPIAHEPKLKRPEERTNEQGS